MNLAKIMTPKILTAHIHENDSVRQGLEKLRSHGFTAVPVLDTNERYLGAITEGDFLRHIINIGSTDMHKLESTRVGELFRRDFCPPLKINSEREQVLEAVLQQNFVPIVDDRGCLCGIITRRSVIKAVTEMLDKAE
ncbi:MAG: CBS domain-containing protein [Eubacterium sp.]|nr:CBS domain-containing protein [Eubacterium sp.]